MQIKLRLVCGQFFCFHDYKTYVYFFGGLKEKAGIRFPYKLLLLFGINTS